MNVPRSRRTNREREGVAGEALGGLAALDVDGVSFVHQRVEILSDVHRDP